MNGLPRPTAAPDGTYVAVIAGTIRSGRDYVRGRFHAGDPDAPHILIVTRAHQLRGTRLSRMVTIEPPIEFGTASTRADYYEAVRVARHAIAREAGR